MQVKPKKSLGQNFLIDNNIIEKISSITEVTNKEILEVGPGTGNLTSFLLKKKLIEMSDVSEKIDVRDLDLQKE